MVEKSTIEDRALRIARIFKVVTTAVTVCGFLPVFSTAPTVSSAPLIQERISYRGISSEVIGFLADENALLKFRDMQDVAAMRKHAWSVFAGLTQPISTNDPRPLWETWFSVKETFNDCECTRDDRLLLRAFEVPRQIGIFITEPARRRGSPLSRNLYNLEACQHICRNKLYLKNTLGDLNQFPSYTPISDRKIKEFDKSAIVLKTTWWVIKEKGVTPLPVWDFEPTRPNSDGNGPETWKRCVAIDPSRFEVSIDETTISCNGEKIQARIVPLKSLYHFPIGDAIDSVKNEGEKLGIPNAPSATSKDDYIALVGFHFTTKEIPDWVWATFWWHDKPDEGPYAMDRPKNVSGIWRNYLMDVTFSMETPREYDGTPNAIYNPWLEAKHPYGLSSNCMACHQRAVWPKRPSTKDEVRGGLAPDHAYFRDQLKLDFLWSINVRSH